MFPLVRFGIEMICLFQLACKFDMFLKQLINSSSIQLCSVFAIFIDLFLITYF